jgi:SAM-dependent methyltransferase
VLEVGGPSSVFGAAGLLPVYPAAAAVDGVQWSDDTIWHGHQEGAYVPDGAPTGTVHIVDGGTLDGLPDGAYDAIVSSHVIEHLANPLRALEAWRRVTRPGGAIVLVAPHMAGTFDHRRPVTTLEHLVADRDNATGEDDLTHLEETLALHDRSRDAEGDDQEAWARLRRENLVHRVLHHHVFTTPSLVALLAHAGIAIDAVETRHPHDIYVAGRFARQPAPVDPAVLRDALRASPFRIDREGAAPPSASAPAVAR